MPPESVENGNGVALAAESSPGDQQETLSDLSLHLQQLLLSSDPMVYKNPSSRGANSSSLQSDASTDDYLEQLAPILSSALKNDSTAELQETLEAATKEKDREIDAICSGDHNEYMASVQQLGQVTKESELLKSKILDLNSRLGHAGKQLIEKKKELIQTRRVKTNVEAAIESVSACLQVLNLTNNVHELLQEKRKFAALKSLDDLQNVHLKEVASFGFAQLINKSVPALTKMITKDTLADLDAWLAESQKMNGTIGRESFDAIEQLRDEWRQRVAKNPQLAPYKFNSPVEKAYREIGNEFLYHQKTQINFSTLYECVLVHNSIGKAEEFRHHFETDRKIQRDYIVPQSLSLKDANGQDETAQFESVIRNIAGFCITDRMISRKLPYLRPTREVEDIWESLCQKLNSVVESQLKHVSSIETVRKIKALTGTFIHAMQNSGYDTSSIEGMLLSLFKRYSTFLRKEFDKNFNQTVMEDDYMPMTVNRPELYKQIVDLAWYHPSKEELEAEFPRSLPFSQIYPLTCAEIMTFLNYHHSFLDDLPYDLGRIEEALVSAVDDMLIKTVCQSLENRLKSTTREQIVQILINLEYFEIAAEEVAKLLSRERISGKRGDVKLEATSAFNRARKRAEQRIFELLNSVVDDFLDLADYDWHTTTVHDMPSSYLQDMVSFLKTLVSSTLVNLPQSVKSFVYFDAFDHIASSVLKFLLEASEHVTVEALANFYNDVRFLEKFVNDIAEDANDVSLTTTVTELRECVNLITSDDMTEYNITSVRMKKYNRVKPETAQILFSKVAYARSLHQQQQAAQQAGTDSKTSSPRPPNTPEPNTSSSSKFMKYYRSSWEKINERLDKLEQNRIA
uniref:Exocyst complex component SEC15 n=1 Tax=Blastobotrys adeninivorans TaxID=409370 RepID=A0A060T420_BLAAD